VTGWPGAQIAWYYHLPAVCGDEEVGDLVDTSLLPVVETHRQTGRKVVLALTGALLARIADVRPSAIDAVGGLVEDGLCELGGTTYHEVFPPLLPLRYLRLQIERDLETKRARFAVEPTVFYPPNFTWTSTLPALLTEAGYDGALLDEDHYVLATSTQLWRWTVERGSRLATTLHETMVERRELHRPYVHPVGGNPGGLLRCFVRDFDLVRRISFGTTGALHRPLEEDAIDAAAAEVVRLAEGGGRVTLADDGDRINPVSLAGYRRFLELLPPGTAVLPSDAGAGSVGATELLYLPSFSIADVHGFWLHDLDALHYARILDEIHRAGVPEELEDALLELQDVFFLFWKTLPRKSYYLDRLLALWRRVCDDRLEDAREGDSPRLSNR
jgi:Glycosyl hydrolase family 57